MEWKLTQEARNHLIGSHKKERDGRARDRIKAVLLYDKGYTSQHIAEILLLDDETVRRHLEDYQRLQKLKTQNGGSASHLDPDQTAKLIAHLEAKTYLYVKEIAAYVETTFGVHYTVSGMTKWLHEHQFRYKKPHGIPAKADEQKQAEFITKYDTLKNTLKPDEIILFGDSTHPQHQTKLAYGWIKKGVGKSEKMTACQKRVNIMGTIDLREHHVECSKVDWVNTDSLKAFAEQLCKAYPHASTIHLILDNAGYHKSKAFVAFIETTKIKLHYLPPYSPNLNPIERLWKIMHEQVTYNRYYEKFAQFTEGIMKFFENIEQYRSILRSRITDNFQILKTAS